MLRLCVFCKICMSHLRAILAAIIINSFLHKSTNNDYFYHQLLMRAVYTSQQHIVLLCFIQPAKNQKWNTLQPATTSVHKKSKIKNTQTQKIDAPHNDHIFYLAATAPCIMLLAAFFTWACSNQARSFAATQQKIVFIIFKMLMFTLVRFVLCPIAISVIILLKVNARL